MHKPGPIYFSTSGSMKSLSILIKRRHIFIQSATLFSADNLKKSFAYSLFRTLKLLRKLTSLRINHAVNRFGKYLPHMSRSLLKWQGKNLRSCHILTDSIFSRKILNGSLRPLKRVEEVILPFNQAKSSFTSRCLKTLNLDLTSPELEPPLSLLKKLYRISSDLCLKLSITNKRLDQLIQNFATFEQNFFSRIRKIELETYGKEVILQDPITVASAPLFFEKVTSFASIAGFAKTYPINLLPPFSLFPNLEFLRLSPRNFHQNGARMMSHIKNFSNLKSLDIDTVFHPKSTNLLTKYLKIPPSLENLRIKTHLSLDRYLRTDGPAVLRNCLESIEAHRIKDFLNETQNIYERDEGLVDFFDSLHGLKSLDLHILLKEDFKPYHIQFFISIVKRTIALRDLAIKIEDKTHDEDELSKSDNFWHMEHFLSACNPLYNLLSLKIHVPSIELGRDIELSFKFPKLESVQVEADALFEVKGNSHRLIKGLNLDKIRQIKSNAVKKISQEALRRRFVLYGRMKNLRSLSAFFCIEHLEPGYVKEIGMILLNLQQLEELTLGFVDCDDSVLEISRYLNYHKKLEDYRVTRINSY